MRHEVVDSIDVEGRLARDEHGPTVDGLGPSGPHDGASRIALRGAGGPHREKRDVWTRRAERHLHAEHVRKGRQTSSEVVQGGAVIERIVGKTRDDSDGRLVLDGKLVYEKVVLAT